MNGRLIKANIETLLEEIDALPELAPSQFSVTPNKKRIDQIINEIQESFGKLFGYESKYYEEAGNLSLKSKNANTSIDGQVNRFWKADKKSIEEFLKYVLDEHGLNLSSSLKKIEPKKGLKDVFVVYGHNDEIKESVARTLEKLGLMPIILDEKPNENKTIMEKIEKYSSVDFAVIIFSPDDFAYPKGKSPSEGKFRPRQNVILELGYFIAKLGRNRVVVLYQKIDNFELLSDYSGVLYTIYDKTDEWKYRLADELKVHDPNIDKNKL
jgi:predicted nucleotide-binding protein